ncbi:S8 family peptidase [Cellulomonas palmilytica]|uniref:S8 family peptidase n=1 Tax=Cellulomonas palmilytica TaxID=2608402 RepID=UPI001F18A256|nr:S8 family serine peptidase [Cellulomonas palmilytica]UJP39878.1 S8 family serine peptidase [Cellulomonas palmilytica]
MRAARTGAVAATGLLLAVAAGVPAVAADADDGMWYYTATRMADLHERTTGKGVQVAVVDTAIWPDAGDLAGTSVRVHEPSFCADEVLGDPLPAAQRTAGAAHGTNMTSLVVGTGKGQNGQPGILGVAPDADVWFYSTLVGPDGEEACNPEAVGDVKFAFGEAIDQAVTDGADIISISLSSNILLDYWAVTRALHEGVIVVVALSDDPGQPHPGSFNGVVTVESAGPDGNVRPGSRPGADVIAPGESIRHLDDDLSSYVLTNGSSAATAFTAGALALVWSAYPEATGNQIIQTLIRNTDGQDHELYHDPLAGYGIVNVRHMLEHDPTTYPDENPLLDHDPDSIPTYEQVQDLSLLDDPTLRDSPRRETSSPAPTTPAPTSTADATETTQPTATGSEGTSSTNAPVLLAAGGGILAAAIAAIALLAARRRRRVPAHDIPPSAAQTADEHGPDLPEGGK